tara:strand:- start:88 stop:300 length:213 start_codon:yes stop_codon:yes gene_type:complete
VFFRWRTGAHKALLKVMRELADPLLADADMTAPLTGLALGLGITMLVVRHLLVRREEREGWKCVLPFFGP